MPCTWVRTIFRNPGFFTLSVTNTGPNWNQCWLDAACSFNWQKRPENYAQGNYSSTFAGFYSMITKIGGLQGEEQPYYEMCASDFCTFLSPTPTAQTFTDRELQLTWDQSGIQVFTFIYCPSLLSKYNHKWNGPTNPCKSNGNKISLKYTENPQILQTGEGTDGHG
jgi:hypothetical protein